MNIMFASKVLFIFAVLPALIGCGCPSGSVDDDSSDEKNSSLENKISRAAKAEDIYSLVPADKFNALVLIKPSEAVSSAFVEKLKAEWPEAGMLIFFLKNLAAETGIPLDQYRQYLLFAEDLKFDVKLEHHSGQLEQENLKKHLVEERGWSELEEESHEDVTYHRGKAGGLQKAFVMTDGGVFTGKDETIRELISHLKEDTGSLTGNDRFANARILLEPEATATLLVWDNFQVLLKSLQETQSLSDNSIANKLLSTLQEAEAGCLLIFLEENLNLKLKLLFADEESAEKLGSGLRGIKGILSMLVESKPSDENPQLDEESKKTILDILDSTEIVWSGNLLEVSTQIPPDGKFLSHMFENAMPFLTKTKRDVPVEVQPKTESETKQ